MFTSKIVEACTKAYELIKKVFDAIPGGADSSVMQGLSMGTEVLKALSRAINFCGGSDADLEHMTFERELVARAALILTSHNDAVVEVDYDAPLSDVLSSRAFTRWEYWNQRFTQENFPNRQHETGVRKRKMRVVNYSCRLFREAPEDIFRELDEGGYRPATLRELAAFDSQVNPSCFHDALIIKAPGSTHRENDNFPQLTLRSGGERELKFGHPDTSEACECKLLVVSKFATFDTTVPETVHDVTVDCDLHVDILFREAKLGTVWSPGNDDGVVEYHGDTMLRGLRNMKMGLFHFGHTMSHSAVLKAMKEGGYRPATLRELIAFYMVTKDKRCVVAFGHGGGRSAPYVKDGYLAFHGKADHEAFCLNPKSSRRWLPSTYRFLGVSEE